MTAIVKSSDWTREQVETIKQTVAKGANDAQLALFLQVCKSRGLDPFTKQVYYTPQGVIVSIDGLRAIADRTGAYAPGATRFEYDDQKNLVAAHVTVKKLVAGTWHEVEASAYYEEYRGGSPIWKKMPRVMLEKCSESRALRKAFPADLSGLYSPEEMDQAQREEPRHTQPSQPVVTVLPVEPGISKLDLLLSEIDAASDMDSLKAVAGRISAAKSSLDSSEQMSLRDAYVAKRNALGGAK
jgi:phage recombination protein Bet